MRVFEVSPGSAPWTSGPEAADTVHVKIISVSSDLYGAPPDPTAFIGAGSAGLWTGNPPTLRARPFFSQSATNVAKLVALSAEKEKAWSWRHQQHSRQ
jgi:hypothetical protein